MVTKDSKIIDVVQEVPESVIVFQNYGLGCIGCVLSNYETVGEGAAVHGIDIDSLVNDINKLAEQKAEQASE